MSAQPDVLNPPTVLSDASLPERWLIDHEAWEALSREEWYLNQEEEPLNYSGKSVLVRWLNCVETEGRKWWRCCVPEDSETWCAHDVNRLDRAIVHVRGHLGLKPYACEGQCGNQFCIIRFGSKEGRNAHCQGPDRRKCEWCGKEELRQNLPRHKVDCPMKPSQPMGEGSSTNVNN